MGMSFKKATREQSKGRVAIIGPSGAGKTYTERRDRMRRSVAALKKALHESLEATGRGKVETPTATVWIQANGQAALEITGEVPKEYTRTVIEPDLERIREKLEAGVELAFAKLVRGSHVRVG